MIARSACSIMAAVAAVLMPAKGQAQQISPNPNTGLITVIGGNVFNSDSPYENYGNIFVGGGVLTNNVGATLNNYGHLTSENSGSAIINNGALNNYGGLTADFGGGIINNAGATLNNVGDLILQGSSLRNWGTFINSGTISYFDGTLEIGPGGLFIDSGGPISGYDSGHFSLNSGTAVFNISAGHTPSLTLAVANFNGGTIALDFTDGYTPTVGDSWSIFSAAYFTGLDTVTFSAGDAGELSWELVPTGEFGPGREALVITLVPEPSTSAIVLLGFILVGLGRVRRKSI